MGRGSEVFQGSIAGKKSHSITIIISLHKYSFLSRAGPYSTQKKNMNSLDKHSGMLYRQFDCFVISRLKAFKKDFLAGGGSSGRKLSDLI